MTPILSFTANPAVDKSTEVPYVAPDEKLRCSAPRWDPGGGGINVSRVIHRLGGSTVALFPSGGPSGSLLERALQDEGIRCETVPIAGWTRENLMVYGADAEQQFRFLFDGPQLGPDEWKACLEAIDGFRPRPRWLVASGSLPPGAPDDLYARVARWGRDHGVPVVVDVSGAAIRHVVAEGVYLLKPNFRELEQLVGRELGDDDALEEACRALVAGGGCEVLLVSLGAGGALLTTRDAQERIASPTVPIASKVGAGDSTVGATVLALARGWEPSRAVRFGVAAGAAAVMTPRTDLCRRHDVESLFERMERRRSSDAA